MQRFSLIASGAVLVLACCSCGGGASTSLDAAGGPARLSAVFSENPGINTEGSQLTLAGDGTSIALGASGLDDTRALFCEVRYDPQALHFTGGTPLVDTELNLVLIADKPETGTVHIGLAVIDLDNRPGFDGSQALAQLNFAPGPARAVSAPPTHPRNAVTLAGQLDAANVPTLTWQEVVHGDGDNNGEVNGADLVPLARNFRQPFTPGTGTPLDSERSDADYDLNGEINGADLVVISQNFGVTLGGYRVRSGATATSFTDTAQIARSDAFPSPQPKGLLTWTWTAAAPITADTFYQVEPYDRDNPGLRGLASANTVQLQPVNLQPTITGVEIGFEGQSTWPGSMIDAGSGDYLVIVTEQSADDIAGNGETFSTDRFAPDFLQLVVMAETEEDPGNPIDITSTAHIGLSEGAGLAAVSLASATRGQLSFKDRGRVVVRTFAPGDFTISHEIGFRLLTIDSMAISSGSGASPANVNAGAPVQFTVTGTFDWDTDSANGNGLTAPITNFCSWGVLPGAGNGGTFVLRPDNGSLLTATAQSGDVATVFAEFPNTDDVRLYDNQKRSTAPFVVNIN